MTEPVLAVRSVSKLFGSVIALSNVSVEVYPGEVTCLLGDNGAGKSTLIKIFAGVHQQTEGSRARRQVSAPLVRPFPGESQLYTRIWPWFP